MLWYPEEAHSDKSKKDNGTDKGHRGKGQELQKTTDRRALPREWDMALIVDHIPHPQRVGRCHVPPGFQCRRVPAMNGRVILLLSGVVAMLACFVVDTECVGTDHRPHARFCLCNTGQRRTSVTEGLTGRPWIWSGMRRLG